MYILGVINRPDTFTCVPDDPKLFLKKIKEKIQLYPSLLLFTIHLPGHENVWGTGVKGKMDTLCFFTTEEETTAQRDKFAKFYGLREVFSLKFEKGTTNG